MTTKAAGNPASAAANAKFLKISTLQTGCRSRCVQLPIRLACTSSKTKALTPMATFLILGDKKAGHQLRTQTPSRVNRSQVSGK